ncbi:uncharacterized protein AB675_8868 [Cyphellophora attinorum]|uniref:DUF7892 domain-containing protein n=1 Tax=Cyphellophora attinorum TaxID=1664694 RepID=A0A0N1NYJ3_9EURO|nr:uncharacterized protein AB675_8868 [Phialophora attinorum]KPI36123.1 hypothetical protein AB675_8868 [Phialophora attinorum]
MLSGSSVLQSGLSFALFTPSFNYVTTTNLRQHDPPTELKLTKYYYIPEIEALENEMAEVQALGSAATQEWFKGLQLTGKRKRDDTERLEQWETSLGAKLQIKPQASMSLPATRSPPLTALSVVSGTSRTLSQAHSHTLSLSSPLRPFSALSSQYAPSVISGSFRPSLDMPLPFWTPAPGQAPSQYTASEAGSAGTARPKYSRPRPAPSKEQLSVLQAEKRAAIEERCQTIDPPIRPSVLPFMEAFRAALQVSMPLNDSSWDHLKGRLLAQRAEAEQKEREYIGRQQGLQFGSPGHQFAPGESGFHSQHAQAWAELGVPARQKLETYAKEYIASAWDDGLAVSAETATKFAADVMIQVKDRFDKSIVDEDRELAARDMVLPHNSDIHEIRKLKLEDMKWLYEGSIRPHIERFGASIFFCRACESSMKHFAFEGLIQHYSAKHTNDFTRGNAALYWKSPWPEVPPFHDPTGPQAPTSHGTPVALSRAPTPNRGLQEPTALSRPPSRAVSPTYAANRARPRNLYEEHKDEVVFSTIAAYNDTAGVRAMPDSVRLYVMIHQTARAFFHAFGHKLSLSLFADCVSHQTSLREVRDLHGLHCHSCKFGIRSDHGVTPEYWLSELLDHFQTVHIDHRFTTREEMAGATTMRPVPMIDWLYDMVDLPHPQIIKNIALSPAFDDRQFGMLASLFPDLIGRISTSPPRAAYHAGGESLNGRAYGEPARWYQHDGQVSRTYVPLSSHRLSMERDGTLPSATHIGRFTIADPYIRSVGYQPAVTQVRSRTPVPGDDFAPAQPRSVDDHDRPFGSPYRRDLDAGAIQDRLIRTPHRTSRHLRAESIMDTASEAQSTKTDAERFLDSFGPLEEYPRTAPASHDRRRGVVDSDSVRAPSSGRMSRAMSQQEIGY